MDHVCDRLLPKNENQLKLLYTAITRCSKQLLFAETFESTAGRAFCKWATFGEKKTQLAVKQAVDDVEQMTRTADEWLGGGVNCATEAERMEDENDEKAIKWLGRAIHNLSRGNDLDSIRKAE